MKFLLIFLLSSNPSTQVTTERFFEAMKTALKSQREAWRESRDETPRICIAGVCVDCHSTSKDGVKKTGVACDLKAGEKHCVGWCTATGCEGGCHTH